MENKIDFRVLITAILALMVIQCVALFNGINGTVMTLIVGAICLIAGVALPFKSK